MRNIRYLSKHFDKKQTTHYAVFFEHDGISARLDWELADDTDGSIKPGLVDELMLKQLEADLEDEVLVEEIRAHNAEGDNDKGAARLQMYLDDGYIEHDVPEFKAKAVEKFGSE